MRVYIGICLVRSIVVFRFVLVLIVYKVCLLIVLYLRITGVCCDVRAILQIPLSVVKGSGHYW